MIERQNWHKMLLGGLAWAVALGSLAACERDPTRVLEMTTEEIVSEIGASTTLEEATTSIRHILTKAGVGTRIPVSRYHVYRFSDAQVQRVARAQVAYVKGEREAVTLGEVYRSLSAVDDSTDGVLELDRGVNAALDELEKGAAVALQNPENPNSALLLAVIAEDGKIPSRVPSYDATSPREPVQAFLFALWAITELQRGQMRMPSTTHQQDPCRTNCSAQFAQQLAVCQTLSEPARRLCIQKAILKLRACLAACHDQGAGG